MKQLWTEHEDEELKTLFDEFNHHPPDEAGEYRPSLTIAVFTPAFLLTCSLLVQATDSSERCSMSETLKLTNLRNVTTGKLYLPQISMFP